MTSEPTVQMHLDIARRGTTLTGAVAVDGTPAQPFVGWIGLNAAIERLLTQQFEDRGVAAEPG